MSTPEQTKNALAKTEKVKGLKEMIQSQTEQLSMALPDHMKPERLVRIALTCIRTTPGLADCTQESFLGALFTSAQIGIEPVAGRAYLLPFYNSRKKADGTWHKVREVQFIMGYKGLTELFYRHEKSIALVWGTVKEKDNFDYELGTHAYLKHKPTQKDRGETLGYYVVAGLAGGGQPFMYMTKDECVKHGEEHSKTYDKKTKKFYDNSSWNTSTDSMCLKTVLIQLSKLLPLSVELQRAIATDETSRDFNKNIDSPLDMKETTNWDAEEAEVAETEKKPNGNDTEDTEQANNENWQKEFPEPTDGMTIDKIEDGMRAMLAKAGNLKPKHEIWWIHRVNPKRKSLNEFKRDELIKLYLDIRDARGDKDNTIPF